MLYLGVSIRCIEVKRSVDPPHVCGEIQYRHVSFGRTQPQPAAKLLHEYPATVRDPHKYDQVNVWHIYSLVENINDAQEVEFSRSELGNLLESADSIVFRCKRCRLEPVPAERAGELLRMVLGGTERQSALTLITLEHCCNLSNCFLIAHRD